MSFLIENLLVSCQMMSLGQLNRSDSKTSLEK